MKRVSMYLISAAVFIFAASCQNSANNQSTDKSSAEKELQALKEQSNDLAEKISNATYAERKNLQDDIKDFASETEEFLSEKEADSKFENNMESVVDNLEENKNILVEEAMQFGTQTEEEWKETTKRVEAKMKEIGNEIDSFFSS